MEITSPDNIWPPTKFTLSVLIATIPGREKSLDCLIKSLTPQLNSEVEVEVIIDPETYYNIGIKRNKLLQRAAGKYVVFIDDDDHISDKYVQSILKATESNPDCIGISGIITFNGGLPKQWHISKKYNAWWEQDNVYYRTPNHISPVRRELALQAGFPEIAFGEDYEYSMRLSQILKTEVIIPGNIYHYDYRTDK